MRALGMAGCLKQLSRTCCWRRNSQARRSFASGLASGTPDYFQVLDVSREATTADVKSSFYRQAKKLHPDVNRNVRPDEARRKFQELADAYATLSDANLRSTHEMMLDLRSKGTFNVKQQHQQRSPPSEPSDAWSGFDGRGGGGGGSAGDWGVWGNAYDSSRSLRKKGDSWLDAVKAEFNASMAHAYQGPRFDVVETGRMYPFDFEAEERAARGVHDHILQIVSGRQLLGYVQEVRLSAIQEGGVACPGELASSPVGQLAAAPPLDSRRTTAMNRSVNSALAAEACARTRDPNDCPNWFAHYEGSTSMTTRRGSAENSEGGRRREEGAIGTTSPCQSSLRSTTPRLGKAQGNTTRAAGGDGEAVVEGDDVSSFEEKDATATVLEFVWMGRVVAASVARTLASAGPTLTSTRRAGNSTGVGGHDEAPDTDAHHTEAEAAQPQSDLTETLTIYGDRGFWRRSPFDSKQDLGNVNCEDDDFVRGGDGHRTASDAIEAGVIAEVRGHGLKHQRRPYISDIFGPGGELTHRMSSMWTPGVHHLTWMSMTTGNIECRATRGWLPPSHMWPFDPRAGTHDIGGWYFERLRRAGTFKARDGVRKEASTLDPAVPILVAAHRTLRREEHNMAAVGSAVAAAASSMASMRERLRRASVVEGQKNGPRARAWSDIVQGWRSVRRPSEEFFRGRGPR